MAADPSTSVDHAASVPEHLHRRRGAARRLAVLGCGHADPLDCLAACRPVPDTPRNLQASRRAWWHLADHGLRSELTEAVLAEGVAS